MRLAHDGDDSNTGRCSHRLGLEFGKQVLLVLVWNGGDDVGQARLVFELELFRVAGHHAVEVCVLVGLEQRHELAGDVAAALEKPFFFRWERGHVEKKWLKDDEGVQRRGELGKTANYGIGGDEIKKGRRFKTVQDGFKVIQDGSRRFYEDSVAENCVEVSAQILI